MRWNLSILGRHLVSKSYLRRQKISQALFPKNFFYPTGYRVAFLVILIAPPIPSGFYI